MTEIENALQTLNDFLRKENRELHAERDSKRKDLYVVESTEWFTDAEGDTTDSVSRSIGVYLTLTKAKAAVAKYHRNADKKLDRNYHIKRFQLDAIATDYPSMWELHDDDDEAWEEVENK